MNNIAYLLALHSINGLGPVRLKSVLEYFQDPKSAWEAGQRELLQIGIPRNVATLLIETRQKLDPQTNLQSIQKSGISWLTFFDDNYPKLLKEIYDPPVVLYFKGEILSVTRQGGPGDEKAIAVVGSRKMTGYGKLVTEKLTKELAEAGLTIVSGLARGVDSQAHKSALEVKGRTLAVLGGGLNRIFPPENSQLANDIAKGFGAVISEFPPDAPSLPGNFPARNRIISGLSLAVLITEAAEDSGSLITAKLALEQGRDVFAVPGPITSNLSRGPSILIREGARLVTSAQEILDELRIEKIQNSKFPPGARLAKGGKVQRDLKLSETEEKILSTLENENKHIDELCRDLSLPVSLVSAGLVKMEICGLVKNLGGGNYNKIC